MKTAQSPNAPSWRPSFWKREHHLDRMSLRELVVAYFQYPAIIAYLALASPRSASTPGARRRSSRPCSASPRRASPTRSSGTCSTATSCTAAGCSRSPLLASTWKRIHYDHHQDPNHLEVLFGALHTTLPTIALGVFPLGYAIGSQWGAGLGGGCAALATGLLTTCFYEFVHCIQHLAYKPKNKALAEMKRRHMAHHFHDENGNYGITTFFWDKVFGTYYDRPERPEKSPTVFNLGYTPEVAEKYP